MRAQQKVGRNAICSYLIMDFQPLEPWENNRLLCEPHGLRYFVMAARADQYTYQHIYKCFIYPYFKFKHGSNKASLMEYVSCFEE